MRVVYSLSIGLVMLAAGCGGEDMPGSGVASDVSPDSPGEELCVDMGPQTPRDIASPAGLNTVTFPFAPPASEMNLCNIHTHTNAEHKGPGFSVFVSDADDGGYACNETAELTEA